MNKSKLFFLWGLIFPLSFAAPLLSADELAEPPLLNLIPVEIQPLGANAHNPWVIHMNSFNVRDYPSLETSRILGALSEGTKVHGRYLIVEESDEEWLEIDFSGQTGYLFRRGFSRVHPANKEMIDLDRNIPYGKELINRWWGVPLDYEPDDLVTIPGQYTRDTDGAGYRLRREAAASLMAMMDAMREDGLAMYVSSAYRSGRSQQSIYTRATQNRPNQRSSAPPGHSEHQLGTTVDLSNVQEGRRSLRNTDPQHAWLKANAARYGWRQTYLDNNISETGYIEEPWHWRYMGVDNP